MASIYANYIKEKTGDSVFENEKGFAIYRYGVDGKSVYITDIYITNDFRKTGAASEIADAIVKEAKNKGCSILVGSVVPAFRESTISLKVLLGYGMTLDYCVADTIYFKKEI